MSRYFIKEGYVENECSTTFEGETPGTYWNEKRISLNATSRIYVYHFVRELMEKRNLLRYLDLGCGPALKAKNIIWPITKDITLIDQPSLRGIVGKSFPEADFIGLDLERDDFQSEIPFDIIVSSDVIEHLSDPNNYLRIIKKNLSEDGIAVLTTPDRDRLMGKTCMRSGNASHVREWNSDEFREYLQDMGFSVRKQFYCPFIPLPGWEYSLSRAVSSVLKTKRWSSCQIVYCGHR